MSKRLKKSKKATFPVVIDPASKFVKFTLRRSTIGVLPNQRACIFGLGLKKLHQERILENTPSVRGMYLKVFHMVDVECV